MDKQAISVILTGPAKIGGKPRAAGTPVTVSATVALQLAASGAINPEAAQALSAAIDMADTPLSSDFDAAVEAAVIAKVAEVRKVVEDQIADLEAKLQAEGDAAATATARIGELEAKLSAETARADAAEKALAEKPASDKPAKPSK